MFEIVGVFLYTNQAVQRRNKTATNMDMGKAG